jgi:Holliday junction resolvase RusA-like endonuclease
MIVRFSMQGTPIPWSAPKTTRKGVSRKDPRLVAWQDSIRLQVPSQIPENHEPSNSPIKISLCFFFEKPEGKKAKIFECGPCMKGQAGDIDRLLTAVLDPLQGIVFTNDARVQKVEMEKKWSHRPGVDMIIEEVEDEG